MNIDENPFSVSAPIVNTNSYQFLMVLLVFTVSPLYSQSPYHADKKVVVLNNGVDYWTWGKGLADRLAIRILPPSPFPFLFFAAWPMLAACVSLYLLRDFDTLDTLGVVRWAGHKSAGNERRQKAGNDE